MAQYAIYVHGAGYAKNTRLMYSDSPVWHYQAEMYAIISLLARYGISYEVLAKD